MTEPCFLDPINGLCGFGFDSLSSNEFYIIANLFGFGVLVCLVGIGGYYLGRSKYFDKFLDIIIGNTKSESSNS